MSSPAPLQSFLGGLGLSVPVHALLLLNGDVFGVSGFLHRAVRGGTEALGAVAGLVLGGAVVGALEGRGPQLLVLPLPQILVSGLLVGLGTRLSKGCTSGHMLSGVSRFSLRSIAATLTFFTTGVITTHIFHGGFPPIGAPDWSISDYSKTLLAFQAIPFAVSTLLYFLTLTPSSYRPTQHKPQSLLRLIVSVLTGFEFALALRLSNLTEPLRVLSFLLLPVHHAFDPSLAFLAAGALPVVMGFYHYARGPEKPRLGGSWSIPQAGRVDAKLLGGATIFGVGWGMAGICPGPGIVNLGRALLGGSGLTEVAAWLAAVVLGGLIIG